VKPFVAALGSLALAACLVAAPRGASSDEKVDFVKDVKPVLESACVKCHGPKDAKGRYRLDNKTSAFRGGEVATKTKQVAVTPGKPDASLLIAFIEATSKDPAKKVEPMPPGKESRKLTDDEKALLRRWVQQGAAWPDKVTLAAPAK
jgi:hypothetical protein